MLFWVNSINELTKIEAHTIKFSTCVLKHSSRDFGLRNKIFSNLQVEFNEVS